MEAAPARAPARSLSANATPQLMGPRLQGQGRKAQSARAVAPSAARRPRIMSDNPVQGNGEEEDVPLAVWQQQQSLLSQQPRRR